MSGELQVDVAEAARRAGVSVATIQTAYRKDLSGAPWDGVFPPPLETRSMGGRNGKRFVKVVDLEAWLERWER